MRLYHGISGINPAHYIRGDGTLDYPDNFETPAFPAGKRIAVSRMMAIATSVAFFLIVCVCGLIIWTTRGATVEPFIISIDKITGAWSIVGHPHGQMAYSATRTMQESVIANFTRDWFTVSGDADNIAMWQSCEREQCRSDDAPAHTDKTCAMYCAASDSVFNTFVYNVIPNWQDVAARGGRMTVDTTSMQIAPIGQITKNGGTWSIQATVSSTLDGDMQIIAFAKVARQTSWYPRTLGYYIAGFNTYRLN